METIQNIIKIIVIIALLAAVMSNQLPLAFFIIIGYSFEVICLTILTIVESNIGKCPNCHIDYSLIEKEPINYCPNCGHKLIELKG